MQNTIEEEIIQRATGIAQGLFNDNDEMDAVGGQSTERFTHDGKEYQLTVDAFWESSDHFDYVCEGINHDFKKSEIGIMTEF